MRSPTSNWNKSRQAALTVLPDDSFVPPETTAFPLSRLRQIFNPAIQSVRVEAIKHSATPATVYRLTLDYGPGTTALPSGAPLPTTLIAKRIAPDWDDDTLGQHREVEFYRNWAGRLGAGLPQVYYAGPEPDTDYNLILLEDVAATHRFFTPTHQWQPDELRRALRTYAHLHVRSEAIIDRAHPPAWLFPRYEQRVRERAAELPTMVNTLASEGVWAPLRDIESLVNHVIRDIQALADRPVTLLHNDVAPQNIGLRQGDTAKPDVVLVDWEMVGWGLPEMDLAYLFMQPFGNTRHLDRSRMLNTYWTERQRLEGVLPPLDERQAMQRHADAVFALWLIPVAYERHRHPFPPGSAPRLYWDSMFTVLGEALQALTTS